MKSAAEKRKWRVAGINFDHFHMGDLLRMAYEQRDAEIVGICDANPARMEQVIQNFQIPPERVFTDEEQCLDETRPDLVIVCATPARHADYVQRLAPRQVHLLIEKPFAASVEDADRMIAAAQKHAIVLAINWPLRWVPSHCTAYQLIREGRIGRLEEVHYYGGNRGPLWHSADKIEVTPTPEMKRESWFYRKAQGGGSLLDYLGYGTTLGTWFHQGARPSEVSTAVYQSDDLEVDEQSITIAKYASGLSHFETRWGTFTDPWTIQPQPKCGFVLKGADGTISSYDYEPMVRLQTRAKPAGEEIPVEPLKEPYENPIQYLIHCLNLGYAPEGPLSPTISRIGQEIVDAAVKSATLGKTVALAK